MSLCPSRDPPDLAALHAACFPHEPWSAEAMTGLLVLPEVFALTESGLGFILARAAAGEAEILAVGVVAAARGRGLGRALVEGAAGEAARRGAEALFLEVAEDNVAALALYRACGFQQVGWRRAYYARPGGAVAALILRCGLAVS